MGADKVAALNLLCGKFPGTFQSLESCSSLVRQLATLLVLSD